MGNRPPAAGMGRPKGVRNKRTVEFMAVLENQGFCPASALIQCFEEAKRTYDNYGTIYQAISEARENTGNPVPVEDNAHKYLKIAADIAKDLAGYAYPKLKAIEHQKPNPLEGMSAEQKLEAMKQAVKVLEMEVKDGR